MLSRDDFVFTIGYDGPAAVVDGQAKRKYGGLSTEELAERGLFRAAYSSAVYAKDPGEMERVAEHYRRFLAQSGTPGEIPLSSLERLFGVLPMEARRSIVL
jgi:hypothetical protein